MIFSLYSAQKFLLCCEDYILQSCGVGSPELMRHHQDGGDASPQLLEIWTWDLWRRRLLRELDQGCVGG